MQPEPKVLCLLRPEFDNLLLPDQLAMIDNCHALDAERARRVDVKNGALVDWIKAQ